MFFGAVSPPASPSHQTDVDDDEAVADDDEAEQDEADRDACMVSPSVDVVVGVPTDTRWCHHDTA